MKAILTIRQTYEIKIEGETLHGAFQVKSDWEGMVALKSESPMQTVIIRPPGKAGNIYDLVPKMLGGNAANGTELSFEVELISPTSKAAS